MKRSLGRAIFLSLSLAAAYAVFLPSCKSKTISQVKGFGTGGNGVTAAFDGVHFLLQPSGNIGQFSGVSDFSLAQMTSGTTTLPTQAKQYTPLSNGTDRPLVTFGLMQIGASGSICRPQATGGVPLRSSIALTCTSGLSLMQPLQSACRTLAQDPTIAVFDASPASTSCKCLKRHSQTLNYQDYYGQVERFSVDCRNSGTASDLQTLCTTLRDQYCPTCQVTDQTCQCATGVALPYSAFSADVEEFRSECAPPAVSSVNATPDTSKVTASPTPSPAAAGASGSDTADQIRDTFEADCERVGSANYSQGVMQTCECVSGAEVTLDQYRSDPSVLDKQCPL